MLGETAEVEEGFEAGVVCGEVGWELEEEWAELAGGVRGCDGGDELGEACAALAEALEVGDALRGFEAETEGWRGDGEPVR